MSPNPPPKIGASPSGEAPQPSAFRRFLTRAEMVTLIGMLIVISSTYLVWMRYTEAPNQAANALFAASINVVRTGSVPSIRLPLTICSVTCGALLLFTTTEKNRLLLALIQGACGLACVVVALSRFALQPGVLIALLGGALLTFGAVDRYTNPPPPENAPQRPA